MNLFEEVKRLDLPPGEYVVIGSGILGALGIRDIADVDLLVSPRVFEQLRERGWVYQEIDIEGRTRQKLTHGVAEAFKDFWYGNINPDPANMIKDAQIIEGIPFLSLEKLMEIKQVLNRPKDCADIALIEKYLNERAKN